MLSPEGDEIMKNNMTRDDLDKIKADIRRKYAEVAKSPEGRFQYPTGRKALDALNYDRALVDKLPPAVASSYCGVGNPSKKVFCPRSIGC
jgi:hypothetical protein